MNMPEAADLTVTEAAARLRVMPATVRLWINSGRLPARKNASGQWRIAVADVRRANGDEIADTADA